MQRDIQLPKKTALVHIGDTRLLGRSKDSGFQAKLEKEYDDIIKFGDTVEDDALREKTIQFISILMGGVKERHANHAVIFHLFAGLSFLQAVTDADTVSEKPLCYLVVGNGISPFANTLPLATLAHRSNDKYQEIKLKNLAVLINYFIVIRKLNSADDSDVADTLDTIINILLHLPDTTDLHTDFAIITEKLSELIDRTTQLVLSVDEAISLANLHKAFSVITSQCETLASDVKDLTFVASEKLTIADFYLSALQETTTPETQLITLVVKEHIFLFRNMDEEDRKIYRNQLRYETLDQYHIALCMNEAMRQFADFYHFLMATRLKKKHLPTIEEKIDAFFSVQHLFIKLNSPFCEEVFVDSRKKLLVSALCQFFLDHKNIIDIASLYKLRALNTRLQKKFTKEHAGNSGEYLDVLRYISTVESLLLNKKDTDDITCHDLKNLGLLLMDWLPRHVPFKKIDSRVRELFPNKKDRANFNKKFFNYKFRNAYQIMMYQVEFLMKEEIESKTDHYYPKYQQLTPRTYGEYVLHVSGEVPTATRMRHNEKKEQDFLEKTIPQLENSARINARTDALVALRPEITKIKQKVCRQLVLNIQELINQSSFLITKKQRGYSDIISKIYQEGERAKQDKHWYNHFTSMTEKAENAGKGGTFKLFGGLKSRHTKESKICKVLRKAGANKKQVADKLKITLG